MYGLNKFLPAILSFLFPGIGQLYCKELRKFRWQFLLALVLLAPGYIPVDVLGNGYVDAVLKIGHVWIVAYLVLWGWSIIEAYGLPKKTDERFDLVRHDGANQFLFLVIALTPALLSYAF